MTSNATSSGIAAWNVCWRSEASRHIDADPKAQAPEIEWRQIASFGNVVRHGYEAVNLQIIWNIVTHDLPPLKAAAARLYAADKRPADPWLDAKGG